VATLILRGGLSVHQQLHIIFLMLPIKNYKREFKLVKGIVWAFFTPDTVKQHLNKFRDILIKSIITVTRAKKFWKYIKFAKDMSQIL